MAKDVRFKRLTKELKDYNSPESDLPSSWKIGPENDENFYTWIAEFGGPDNTPYKYGIYKIRIVIPAKYPFTHPTTRFITNIFHPNVYTGGDICVDILGSGWTPANSIESLVKSLMILLQEPNPDSPANSVAANLYRRAKENKFEGKNGYERTILSKILKHGNMNKEFKDEFYEKLKKYDLELPKELSDLTKTLDDLSLHEDSLDSE